MKFPLFGTGLGTHAVVYPMFDRSTIPALAAHAENEYAQLLEETGLAGLGVLIIFGFIIWSNYAKCVRNNTSPIFSAVYGLGFGLLAILIHSLSDFGQHLPANTFLSAIFCALIVTLAQWDQKCVLSAKFRMLNIGIITAIVSGLVWAIVGSNNARLAEVHWNNAVEIEKVLVANNWQGTEAQYNDLISNASTAVKYDPQNIEYQYRLNVYRWRRLPRKNDPETGQEISCRGLSACG